jgi:hypothetical protein
MLPSVDKGVELCWIGQDSARISTAAAVEHNPTVF